MKTMKDINNQAKQGNTKKKTLKIEDLKGAKPHFTKNGNIKLGKNRVYVWSTMKGSPKETRYIQEYDGLCSGTCGKYCKDCTFSCYVNRSYRYASVIKGHTINTVWMKENEAETFDILEKQLSRARKKPNIIRINQSGELMTNSELVRWYVLSLKYPNIQMYLYTKNMDAVDNLVEGLTGQGQIGLQQIRWPSNFTILCSIWHEQGVSEFEKYKDISGIKAFVYDDSVKEGKNTLKIKPQVYCQAYDEKGKMNHNITCDKCKMCFNRNEKHKIIGCHSH